jgi:hypothetical protein
MKPINSGRREMKGIGWDYIANLRSIIYLIRKTNVPYLCFLITAQRVIKIVEKSQQKKLRAHFKPLYFLLIYREIAQYF